MSAKNKGGRPRKYTAEQVEDAIERVEARDDVADGASVKEVMHEELGVSPGIDVTILDAEVQRICKVRAEEKAKLLVSKLPDPAREAAAGVGSEVARAVTNVLADQFERLGKESRKREAEIGADLRMFRQRVQDLEAQIAINDASYASQEEKTYGLMQQLAAKDAMIAGLNAEIAQLGRQDDLERRFVEIVKGFIAGNMLNECNCELKSPA
ncbi:MAG: hypothetical protein ACSHXI_22030 [Hoeflea sp.]|uniref:hypothetical protein n=1 Tax=Hoeflea sp. TaxID=1940281 RepID=UPI003EF92722